MGNGSRSAEGIAGDRRRIAQRYAEPHHRDIKGMVLGARNELGGTKYLAEQAQRNPAPFLALLGKVLPHTIIGTGADGAIEIKLVKFGEPKTIDVVDQQ